MRLAVRSRAAFSYICLHRTSFGPAGVGAICPLPKKSKIESGPVFLLEMPPDRLILALETIDTEQVG